MANDNASTQGLGEQSAWEYAHNRAKDFPNVNIDTAEMRELSKEIGKYINYAFLSLDVIKIVKRGGAEPLEIGFAAQLAATLCMPIPLDKLRTKAIKESLKLSVHFGLYRVKTGERYAEDEFDELMGILADEITNYSVLSGDKRTSTGKIRNAALNVIKMPFKKAIKLIEAPVNVINLKSVFGGIHYALTRYCINREVFGTSHRNALEEAAKGYREVLMGRALIFALALGG